MRRSSKVWVWAGTLLLSVLLACGPKSMKARIADGERISDRAAAALDDGEKALAAGDLDRAEDRVRDAERALADPDVATNPESELLKTRLADLKAKVPEARWQRHKEELAKKVAARREIISKSVTQFRRAIGELEEKPGDRAALQAARDAARRVRDDVEWDKDLPAKDLEFKGYLDGLRQDLEDGNKALATAEKVMELVDGPLRARDEAAAASGKAKAEKQPDEKVKLFTQAQDGFRRCAEDAERAIAATPALEKATVTSQPKPATGAAVVKECQQQAEATGKLLASAKKVADAAAKKAELARKKAEAAEKRKAEAEARKAELARKKAEAAEKRKAEAEARKKKKQSAQR